MNAMQMAVANGPVERRDMASRCRARNAGAPDILRVLFQPRLQKHKLFKIMKDECYREKPDQSVRADRHAYALRRLVFTQRLRLVFFLHGFLHGKGFQGGLFGGEVAGFAEHLGRRQDHVMSGGDIDLAEMEQSGGLSALIAELFIGDQRGGELGAGGVEVIHLKVQFGHAGARGGGECNVFSFMSQSERAGMEIKGSAMVAPGGMDGGKAVHDERLALLVFQSLPDLKGAAIALHCAIDIAHAGFSGGLVLQRLAFPRSGRSRAKERCRHNELVTGIFKMAQREVDAAHVVERYSLSKRMVERGIGTQRHGELLQGLARVFLVKKGSAQVDEDGGFLFVVVKRGKEFQGPLEVFDGVGEVSLLFVIAAKIIERDALFPGIACKFRLAELIGELVDGRLGFRQSCPFLKRGESL